jgi:hypothetical protein
MEALLLLLILILGVSNLVCWNYIVKHNEALVRNSNSIIDLSKNQLTMAQNASTYVETFKTYTEEAFELQAQTIGIIDRHLQMHAGIKSEGE